MLRDEECTCDDETDEHECPFATEINDNYDLCACCPHCEHECAMDI